MFKISIYQMTHPRWFAFIFLWSVHFLAYTQLSIYSEIRPRFEIRDGYRILPDPDDTPAAFVAQRNRLGIGFINGKVETGFALQNILIWGSEPLKSNMPSVGLHEAWIRVKLSDSAYLKAGRQEIFYDNQRLLSNNDWLNQSQKHDLLLFQYFSTQWRIDVGLAFNQQSERLSGTEYNLQGNYKVLNFVFLSGPVSENGIISLLSIHDGFQSTVIENKTNFRFTSGGSYLYKADDLTFYAAGYIQTGTSPTNEKINAWYGHFSGGYGLHQQLIAEAGLEAFSGRDYTLPGENRIRAFDAAYGSGHRYNGSMDFFTTPAHTKGAGLVNPYISLVWKQDNVRQIRTDIHVFSLQNKYVVNEEVISKYLGTEVDLTYSRKITRELTLQCGYSVMFADRSMEIIRGGSAERPVHWGFISLGYKPVISFK